MSRLSRHIKEKVVLEPIHKVLLDELSKGEDNLKNLLDKLLTTKSSRALKKLKKDSGFNEGECRYVLKNIKVDIRKCESQILKTQKNVACFGDRELGTVYKLKSGEKKLDLLAVCCPLTSKRLAWFLGECKFEVKTQVGGPFAAEDNFEEVVDRKFKHVCDELKDDKEPYYRDRIILVVSNELRRCERHLRNLKKGSSNKKIAWCRYILCSVDNISKIYANAVAAFTTTSKRHGESVIVQF